MTAERNETVSSKQVDLWDSNPSMFPHARSSLARRGPQSELQALMEAAPHTEPEEVDPTGPLREAMAEAISRLDPLEQMVVEALFFEGLSLRQAEERFARGRSTIQRIRDNALEHLQPLLADMAAVKERIGE